MHIHASGGDQRGLDDQQKNPTGKRRAVDVDEEIGQRSFEHSRPVIGWSEPQ